MYKGFLTIAGILVVIIASLLVVMLTVGCINTLLEGMGFTDVLSHNLRTYSSITFLYIIFSFKLNINL